MIWQKTVVTFFVSLYILSFAMSRQPWQRENVGELRWANSIWIKDFFGWLEWFCCSWVSLEAVSWIFHGKEIPVKSIKYSTHTHTYTCTHIHTHTHTHIHMHTHTRTRAHTHARTHAHTHTAQRVNWSDLQKKVEGRDLASRGRIWTDESSGQFKMQRLTEYV